ncbi:MAG TPA: response regulator [Bacteroidia bacterium]|nr:response regulator [Bacteroidia bacterium]
MDKPLSILLLEDNPSDVKLLQNELKKAQLHHTISVVDSKEEFVNSLKAITPDVVLSDHSLPSFNSLEALRIVRQHGLDIPFILVTGTVSEEFAVQCMKEGADDYILKSSLTRLPASIENNLRNREVRREKKMIELLHAKLQAAYSEIAQMHKDITDSIDYACRIQTSMLPNKKALKTYIPDSLIVYKPKDVVSGDFYWFKEVDGKIVVVVADCTGHGVPGALMSMVGNNLLNEIISGRMITEPAEILTELHTGVRSLLKQDTDENPSQDGMDISICTIDKQNKLIEFAGANHNLFFFRERTLNLIKGDRKSVGGYQRETERVFTNYQLRYHPGDTLYMFSDGYADQFGGRKQKRMHTRNLVRLLHSSLSLHGGTGSDAPRMAGKMERRIEANG